jgi:molybdenum cofactor cytidylyltransferase
MGSPKQLLTYRGYSLLRHIAEVAIASPCQPIAVVLGAAAEQLRPELDGLDLQIAINPDWTTGMGSSIRVGLTALMTLYPELAAVLLLLCDQPLVSVQLLAQICEAADATDKLIVASEYAETVGVPALFKRQLFSELLALSAAGGAKQVMQGHLDQIHPIAFPGGAIDLDTLQDYQAFLAEQNC